MGPASPPMARYDYALAPGAIAQTPVEPRDQARLLDATAADGTVVHRRVADLPELLSPGDLVVVNDTRVLPARLALRKSTGGAAEVLLLEPLETVAGAGPSPAEAGSGPALTGWWRALVRPSRRLPAGTTLHAPAATGREDPVARVGARLDGGCRAVQLLRDASPYGCLALPPYIRRPLEDPDRYQTVYATRASSVAAPTAGLHFTPEVLEGCRRRGIEVASVELAVGLDTFRPITANDPDDHTMHSEYYRVPAATWSACRAARRVVAIGTTTVRALEATAATGIRHGRTDLFIRGSYPFQVVDVLMTNFHQPRSSLLPLVEAFAGPRWRELYATAIDEGYRFLSFGDAMIVSRPNH